MARKRKTADPVPPIPDPPPQASSPQEEPFPIVALGASAGGLEALQQFLAEIPARPGMAFIINQHLDPNHPSQLAGLLQKHSLVPVIEAEDNSQIKPDTVYVIPPHKNMVVVNQALQLMDQQKLEGPSHNIDIFFRSLAEDQKERAICVVLSGTGTDGTLGLRAGKAELGLAIAQDPATAAFNGMPNSAIDTGIVDFVLPPSRMYAKLKEYVREYYGRKATKKTEQSGHLSVALQSVIIQLRTRFGVDFSV
jgi:chemotaxis response regulator CheB